MTDLLTHSDNFTPFPKIARLNRKTIYTEKIDGSNAAIGITDAGNVWAQSRKRVVTPGKQTDLVGFAGWVADHTDRLKTVLGPGLHFGEWYGRGIQRGYDITEDQGHNGKFFALFNVGRWTTGEEVPEEGVVTGEEPWGPWKPITNLGVVPGLTTVPVLGVTPSLVTVTVNENGDPEPFIEQLAQLLRKHGSFATGADGFARPEGVVAYHTQGNLLFKMTLERDDAGKNYGG